MTTISLKDFGPIIGSKTAGDEIYSIIKTELKNSDTITIEMANIKSMATFCAKQIFGRLYLELGSESFYERIVINGADKDLKTIIQIGIQHALEEKS